MNIIYKHGIREQGKEILVTTEELEDETIAPTVPAWTLRRRGVYGVALLFSFCVVIILAVIGDSLNCEFSKLLFI